VAHDITATSTRLVLDQVSFQLTPERAVSSAERSAAGNLFYVHGPLTAKLRWPVVARVHGTCMARDAVERD